VVRVVHRAGAFGPSHPQAAASEDNERQSIWLKTASGKETAVVQIAGRFARRIVCNLREGQKVLAGQRLGLIRFGSRVDVYLAEAMRPLVVVGQRTVAGETILVDERSREAQRKGEIR
jgi:phosphatidylserine decarboxylase